MEVVALLSTLLVEAHLLSGVQRVGLAWILIFYTV
jgi:hypothetical protein